MAYTFGIRIDGVEIPPPSGYSFDERDLTVNSHRDSKGVAKWDVVRANVGEITLEWENLDADRIKPIIAAIRSKKSFQVRFFNPLTGQWETRTFYSGDRSSQLVRFISASKYWASLSVPFVEV